jgi:hypothetical protein
MSDESDCGSDDLTPPRDAVLSYLLREALAGALPVFVGAVPLDRLRRFRDDFRPERTPGGERVVRAIFAQWRSDAAPRLWVYPRGDVFMVSDDYLTLAAAERAASDLVPCWILGPVPPAEIEHLRGPVEPRCLWHMVGIH